MPRKHYNFQVRILHYKDTSINIPSLSVECVPQKQALNRALASKPTVAPFTNMV